jgi:hypothetical protein
VSKTKNVKGMNAMMPDNRDNHKQLQGRELDAYIEKTKALCRPTGMPAVNYKGELVPVRVMTDFSCLTRPITER